MSLLCLVLLLGVAAVAQQRAEGAAQSWRLRSDSDSVQRGVSELTALLLQHKVWLESNCRQGHQLDLRGASLARVDMSGWPLILAIMDSANLEGANLTGAVLIKARLMGANLKLARLDGAWLDGADLRKANLQGAQAREAHFSTADLTDANLSRLKRSVKLSYTINWPTVTPDTWTAETPLHDSLTATLLNGADFSSARARGAQFTGAVLAGSSFLLTDLEDAFFDPDSLPTASALAEAQGLRTLRYYGNPAALVRCATEFADNGFRHQEREIICALQRHEAGFIKRVFFDWTCEYGSNLGRPLLLVLWLWVISVCCYYVSLFGEHASGIRLIEPIGNRDSRKRDWKKFLDEKQENYVFELRCSNESLVGHWPNPRLVRLPLCVRLVWWASFFSTISAFNIGFRDINFGRWLRLLTRREFDLRPYGWVRVISGLQALISVYLVALWILSFAGTPFK